MAVFLSVGEAMVELARSGEGDLWRLGFAGDTLNTAWYARAMLPDSWQVEYFSRLGRDPFSQQLRAFMAAHQIGTRFVSEDAQRSVGLYAIHTTHGERSFTYWREHSAARRLAMDPALIGQAFAAADVIFFSGVTLAILPEEGREALVSQLVQARAAGKRTAFDPNLRPKLWEDGDAMRQWLTRAAEGAEILLPGFEDEATWFGDATPQECARRWQAAGAAEVIVKDGGGAVLTLVDGAENLIPLERVAPFDTTGAGDAFNGGYLAARLGGASAADAVRAGHTIALEVISRAGALVKLGRLAAL